MLFIRGAISVIGRAVAVALARGLGIAFVAMMISDVAATHRGEFLATWTILFAAPIVPLTLVEAWATGWVSGAVRAGHRRTAGALFTALMGAAWFVWLSDLLPFYRPLGVAGAFATLLAGGFMGLVLVGPTVRSSGRRVAGAALLPMSVAIVGQYLDPEERYAQRYRDTQRAVAALTGGAEPSAPPSPPLENRALAAAVAQAYIATHPADRTRWSWEEAVAMLGLLDYAAAGRDASLQTYVHQWVARHTASALRMPLWADVAAPTITLVSRDCATTHLPDAQAQLVRRVESYILAAEVRTRRGAISHSGNLAGGLLPAQAWVDSQFMHGVFLARLASCAAAVGEHDRAQRALRMAVKQARAFAGHLQDERTGLYRHAVMEIGPVQLRLPVEDYYWARGNAWALFFLIELEGVALAQERPGAPEPLRRLLPAVLAAQDPKTGLFRNSLRGPTKASNAVETSASALIAAALIRGLRSGAIPSSLVERSRTAAQRIVRGLRHRIVWRGGRPFVVGTTTGTSPGYGPYYDAIERRESVGHGVGAVLMALSAATQDF